MSSSSRKCYKSLERKDMDAGQIIIVNEYKEALDLHARKIEAVEKSVQTLTDSLNELRAQTQTLSGYFLNRT